jgi:hypothetical protein
MAEQKISAAQREAIFRAYDGKCFYTRVTLNISTFHIDHIIPERLLADPQRLLEVRAALQLPDGFDLRGYGNLVPTAPERNLQKSVVVFNEHDARYYLALAREKTWRVGEELAKITRRQTSSKIIVWLEEAIESGKLAPKDISRLAGLLSAIPRTLVAPILDSSTAVHRIKLLKEFEDFDTHVRTFSQNSNACARVFVEGVPDLNASKQQIERSWRIVIGEDSDTHFVTFCRIALGVDDGSMRILGRDLETWLPFNDSSVPMS